MSQLQIENLVKVYGTSRVLHGINLDVADKEFVVFVGPSGCGKSTTLRMIAGLEHISGGKIRIGDRVINKVPPGKRDIAMVFQNYALYPHMTVRENMAFCLEQRRAKAPEVRAKVNEAAEVLRITDLLERRPSQLSGGQRQRVAMGRAIVRNPHVFLFDEPLSNLDAKLRVQMRSEIKRLHRIIPTTTIYVTHDQTEAMTMADRVVVMNGGYIEQVGAPLELYENPKSTFVAGFIGSPPMNLLPAQLVGSAEAPSISLENGSSLPMASEGGKSVWAAAKDKSIIFGIRPEAISISPEDEAMVPFDVVIEEVEPLGIETIIYFNIGEASASARIPPHVHVNPGDALKLYADMSRARYFDSNTQRAIEV
nr:sn-glycerol-3-phosphate ABC transporter ATP-binding protein UgpC [uncultured Cohaesibacter sp.]